MASRKPIVAFNVSSNPELVEDGVTGELVAKEDAAGLARSLQKLAGSEELRKAHGSPGRGLVERKSDFGTNLQLVADFICRPDA